MTEQQPKPYGYDALDAHIDDLVRAVQQYCATRILDGDSPIGPTHTLEKAAGAVMEARRKLRAYVASMTQDANAKAAPSVDD